jgi:hypothetical protein
MSEKSTRIVTHKRIGYRAIVSVNEHCQEGQADIEVQRRLPKTEEWTRLALGMFGAGGLDLGDDTALVPSEAFERLHDLIEGVMADEDDFEDDDEA